MADKSFGVKELNLLNASGTPTVTSPNNLNLNANTVAISTSATVGNNLTVTSTTNSANLNVTGIGTLTRAFATDLSVSGVTTITVPANANPHSSWDVVNNSASSYRFTGPGQDGAEDNPNIYLVRGQRYVFKMNASGHPFQIRVANGGAAYSDGVTNNGSQTGNVVFNVQHDAPAQLYYQCTSHGGMVGNIYIVGGPQVISGVVTATTFVGNLTGTASANAVLTGSTNDQLVTVTGANAITGESALTYTNNILKNEVSDSSGLGAHILVNNSESSAGISLLGSGSSFSSGGWAAVTDAGIIRSSAGAANGLVLQAASGDLKFYAGGNPPAERLRITSGGFLKVNSTDGGSYHTIRLNTTTNNQIKDVLHVHSSVDGATAAAGYGVRLNFSGEQSNGNEYTFGGIAGLFSSTGATYGDLAFYTNNNGTNGERLRIASNGNIFVNNGNANANATLILSKSASGFAKLEFDEVTSQKAYIELDASEDLVHFGAAGVNQKFYAGNGERAKMTADGYSKFTSDGTYDGYSNAQQAHEFRQSLNKPTLWCSNSSTAQTWDIIRAESARTNNSAFQFFVATSGNLTDDEFRVRGDGNVYADGTFSPNGADYAEYFEWTDGNSSNEDRRGMTVVLDGNKIKVSTSSDSTDNIIGVVSGNASVIGDSSWNKWSDKYLRDDYGAYQRDENGERKLNPSFDDTKTYVSREDRQEWDAIGMVGKLRIRKGQTTGTRWIKMRDISDTVEEWLVR